MPCRKTFRAVILTLLFTGLSVVVSAQDYEKIKKTFRITYVYPDGNTRDTSLVYIPATNKSGLEPGSRGTVLTQAGDYNNYILEIGSGFVVSSDSSGTFIYVTLSQKALTDSQYMVKVGDIITLDIRVPKRERKGIFYELDLVGVSFYKLDDNPLYNFEQTISRDSKSYNDSLVSECIKECKTAFNKLEATPDLDAYYTDKSQKGRHKGKSIMDVLRSATPKDILSFLAYAKEYNSNYRGRPYLFAYSFARWISNGSRFSPNEMLDTLLALKLNSKQFISFVDQHKQNIIDYGYVETWAFKAMNEESAGKQRLADSILSITYSVAKSINDTYGLGLHFLASAQVSQYRDKYKEAVVACDSGLAYIQPDKAGFYYVELMIKKALCLQSAKMLNESISTYNKAIATVNTPSFDTSSDSKNTYLGKLYSYKASAYKAFDDSKNAAEAYRQSIAAYKNDPTYNGLLSTATAQSNLADVYKNQGAYADASDIYNELTQTYTQLNDVKGRANNYNSLAYVQFKQGKYPDAIKNYRSAQRVFTALKIYGDAAFSLSNIGQAYWNLGKYDSAIISHNASIENGKLAGDYSRQAYSWSQLGSLYNLTGEKNKALNAYDSSLQYYETAKDSAGLLSNLYDVGSVYEKDGQYQKAFGYYSKAHNLNLKKNDKSELVNSFYKMAYASYNYDTAISRKNYEFSYKLAKEIADLSNTLYCALNLGLLATRQYQYELANKYYTEGLKLAIDQKSKADESWAYLRIADGESQKLDYDKAIELYNKAYRIYDSLGEKSKLPSIISSIAYSFECKGNFPESLVYFEKMKAMGYELKNYADVASALSSMSFVYSLFGEHKKAVESADSALQVFKDLNNNWQIANTYGTMGSVYSGMGEYETAIKYHMLSDSLYRIEKDDVSRSIAQNNMGVVYYFQADYDKALTHFLEADRLSSVMKTVNESVLISRINIGEIYLLKKNYELASKYLTEANKISREKKVMRCFAVSSLLLGKISFENRKTDEALKYFKEAREACRITNENDRIVEVEIFLGKAYDVLKEAGAPSHFYTAIELGKKIRSKYLWQAYYESGLYFYSREQYDSASAYFKEAVVQIEETATKLFGGAEAKKLYAADQRKVDLYNKLVASLAKLKKTEEALYYADKSNSQAIKEKLEQSGIITSDKEKTEALKKGGELLQKQTAIEQSLAKEKAKPEKERNDQLIASLESVRKVAEEDYLNFINELVIKYPEMQSYFTKTNPADFRNSIEYIPDSTLVVLYVINDKQLYIFTVTSQETAIKVVELKEDINKHAMRLLGIIQNPENATGTGAIQVRSTIPPKGGIKGDFKVESSLLYDLLITPIADQLNDKKSLCIIPNGALCRIPFATLGKTDESNRFHFLVEDFGIFYTNKMEIFLKPFKKSNISASFVAFGNPDKSLPGAAMEVNNIKDLYPNATVYLEQEATEEKAKTALKSSKYIHFATHGILNNEDFTQSFLLMNKDATNDGRFTLSEINGLIKDETDMIFLSACEMAIPKDLGKGWDVSILNALLINRVRTVAGGLWQVPDEATMEMVDVFYKNVKTMSRSEALRQAQATMSKNPKYQHPFFWAAFVMYGDWR